MLNPLSSETTAILNERFGQDRLITIGTSVQNIPYLRAVNAIYQNGWFYFVTFANSSKMKQMEENPVTAICGPWFNGHGTAINLGPVSSKENYEIYLSLRHSFESWMKEGNISSTDDVILCGIQMKTGTLYHEGQRYDLLFEKGR